jgi:hypothetical protein
VLGFIDKKSPLGRLYRSPREQDPFYRHACFYWASDVAGRLGQAAFQEINAYQPMIGLPER